MMMREFLASCALCASLFAFLKDSAQPSAICNLLDGQCDYPSLYFLLFWDQVVHSWWHCSKIWANQPKMSILRKKKNILRNENEHKFGPNYKLVVFFPCKNFWWGIYIRTIKSWHLMIGANWQEVPFCPTFAIPSLWLIDWLGSIKDFCEWSLLFSSSKVASTEAVRAQGLGFFSSNLHSLSRRLRNLT